MKVRMGGGRTAITSLAVVAQTLLPTPKANDGKGASTTPGKLRHRSDNGRARGPGDANLPLRVLNLLATPQAYDGERGGPQDPVKRRAGGHIPTLQDQVCFELLPTPSVSAGTGGQACRGGDRRGELLLGGIAPTLAVEWGAYAPAIRRWEALLGRPAPCPAEPGQKGRPRLAPPFVEWMMGLPPGWVTGIEGLSRARQLRLLGNGVVPRQAELALRLLLPAALVAGGR
jgi:hypothetical protein